MEVGIFDISIVWKGKEIPGLYSLLFNDQEFFAILLLYDLTKKIKQISRNENVSVFVKKNHENLESNILVIGFR